MKIQFLNFITEINREKEQDELLKMQKEINNDNKDEENEDLDVEDKEEE